MADLEVNKLRLSLLSPLFLKLILMKRLNKTLAEFQEKFESGTAPYNVSAEKVSAMYAFDKSLRDGGVIENVLRPGDHFPEFALSNQDGRLITLENALLRGPVVISFFRGIWCPYCNIELRALQNALNDLEGAGATLIAISPQLPNMNKRIVLENRLMYDILSDPGNRLSDRIGVTYQLSETMIEKVYKPLGVDLSRFNGDQSWRLPLSSRFVIDESGVIVSADADINYRKRTDPVETLAIVKAITRRASI